MRVLIGQSQCISSQVTICDFNSSHIGLQILPMHVSPANRPLPPIPSVSESSSVSPSTIKRNEGTRFAANQINPPLPLTEPAHQRPRVPKMGTASRIRGGTPVANLKAETVQAESAQPVDLTRKHVNTTTTTTTQGHLSIDLSKQLAVQRKSCELSISISKPDDAYNEVHASSLPNSEHAYAEYLTISPKPSNYCSISPHESDDGYTSLNNMEKQQLSNEDDKGAVHPKQQTKKTNRRRLRVLARTRRSSSCLWSSTSEGGGTVVSQSIRQRSRSRKNIPKDAITNQGIVDGMYRLKLRRVTDTHYLEMGNKNLVRKYRMKSRHANASLHVEGVSSRKAQYDNRSSSCHCHRSNQVSTTVDYKSTDPILEVVYDSVKSDAETDLQPLLSSCRSGEKKKVSLSSTYYSSTVRKDSSEFLPPQFSSTTSRQSYRVRKQRTSTARYDSCTLVTMLVV